MGATTVEADFWYKQISDLPYDVKLPMILPAKHQVSGLIVCQYHQLNGHVGTYQVLAEVRRHFWIVNAVSTIECVTCVSDRVPNWGSR